ncbi:MAG: hypothetical protein ACI4NM_10610, partial [Bullifex sp.]
NYLRMTCKTYVLLVKNMGSYHSYPGYLIYAEALYVFIKLGTAIKWFVKKPDSASLAAARIIKASQALVSIIFLAGSMICTFGTGSHGQMLLLVISGIGVFFLLICMFPVLVREGKRLSRKAQG